ncbi:hypothetical protein [Paraburkholderia tropica]|uniref:hypothetical protein n=1 Tax=Paraburkholderia tropica TaxID=92647 RepID=UPI002AB6FE1E|nr:hypothetical protein [Paraburkholderia tropica]
MSRSASSRATSRAEIAASIERRMQQQGPSSAANEPLRSLIRLPVHLIDLYERNPRTKPNARLADIKEAILNTGKNEQPPIVTRRPGAERYVVAGGGNTRVLAQREVYAESGDERFAYIDCVYTPYTNETDLLAAHIAENSNREDLCFWDSARSIMNLRADLERDLGKPLSLRELSDLLGKKGVTAGRQWLSIFRFTVERLASLEHAGLELSSKDVQERLQPAYSRLSRLAEKLSIEASMLEEQVFQPALELARMSFDQNRKLDVPGLILSFNKRFADVAGLKDVDAVQRLQEIIEHKPELKEDSLRALLDPVVEDRSEAVVLTADGPPVLVENDTVPAPNAVRAPAPVSGGAAAATPAYRPPVSPGAATSLRSSAITSDLESVSTGSREQGDHAVAASTVPQIHALPARQAFQDVLREFAQACGIAECVRDADAFPFWFIVEPPALEPGERPLDAQAAAGERPERYYGWWWLVFLSSQNTPAGMQLLPDGPFAQICQSNDVWDAACLETIGELVGPDQFYRIVESMCNPDDQIGQLYFDLLRAIRRVREGHPERFCPQFWIDQGVDARFATE